MDHADVKIRSLFAPSASVKSFTLKAKGEDEFISFASMLESLAPYPLHLNIDGKVMNIGKKKIDMTNGYMQIGNVQIINNVNGKIGKLQIATPEPITITVRNWYEQIHKYAVSILAPHIKTNDGKLNLDLGIFDNQVKSKLLVTNFPIGLIRDLLPRSFDKSLASGRLELNGKLQSPDFDSELEVSNIKPHEKNSVILKLSANIQNNQLSINSDIFQEKTSVGSFKAQLPCKLSLSPFLITISQKDPISASLKINQQADVLALIPLPPAHRLKGGLHGQLNAAGSIESPIFNGEIVVNQAEYKYQNYGIKLKDISTKILARNKDISITNFVAKDAYSNSLEASGSISIIKDLPFKFHLNTKKFSFMNTPYLQGEAQGEISISGNSTKALAKGSFILGPMEIKIPEHFSDNIPTINIIEITDKNQIIHEVHNKPYSLELDIDLSARQHVYVRGWGVNTLLVGDLKITNNVTDPHIFGKLTSVRGRYQEFGKLLTVKEGVLTFNGPISPSPYLNIVGVTVVDGTEIRLILAGSIFAPEPRIESTPSLSQENALSLLLFGKNPDSISTIQGIGLYSGIRRLSGKGGDFDPLGFGRKILGVDDINIKNDENTGATSVGVGKYLTDKVYIEIEQGDQDKGTKARVEMELTPKISLEGAAGEKGNGSVGVNWRFDY